MTTHQLSGAADNLADAAPDLADRVGSTIHDAARTVRRETGKIGENVRDAGARATQYAKSTVEQQPLLSLIDIAAIGFTIPCFIHSRSSPFASQHMKTC
jgi:hypothetical protein